MESQKQTMGELPPSFFPSAFIWLVTLLLWSFVLYFSFSKEIHPFFIKFHQGIKGYHGSQNALIAVCIFHGVEVVLGLGFAFYYGLPLKYTLFYSVSIFFIGITALKLCIRASHYLGSQSALIKQSKKD